MNSKAETVYSGWSGQKPKAYTSFVPYLKVFKDDLYNLSLNISIFNLFNCIYNTNNNLVQYRRRVI